MLLVVMTSLPWLHLQVQFDEWEDIKTCNIIINDDEVFEGSEMFHVALTEPVYSLMGASAMANIHIQDSEDGQFPEGIIKSITTSELQVIWQTSQYQAEAW